MVELVDGNTPKQTSFSCPFGDTGKCNKPFKTLNNLRAHIYNGHPENYDEWFSENYPNKAASKQNKTTSGTSGAIKPLSQNKSKPVETTSLGDKEYEYLDNVLNDLGIEAKPIILRAFVNSAPDDFEALEYLLVKANVPDNKKELCLGLWSKHLMKQLPKEIVGRYPDIKGYTLPKVVRDSMASTEDEETEPKGGRSWKDVKKLLDSRASTNWNAIEELMTKAEVAQRLKGLGYSDEFIQSLGLQVPQKQETNKMVDYEINGKVIKIPENQLGLIMALAPTQRSADEKKPRQIHVNGQNLELHMTDSEYNNYILQQIQNPPNNKKDGDDVRQYVLPNGTTIKTTPEDYANLLQNYYNTERISKAEEERDKYKKQAGEAYGALDDMDKQQVNAKLQNLEKQNQELMSYREDPTKSITEFKRKAEALNMKEGVRTPDEEAALTKIKTQSDVTAEAFKTGAGIAKERFSQPGGLNSLGNALAKGVENFTSNPDNVKRITDRFLGPNNAPAGDPVSGSTDADIEARVRRFNEQQSGGASQPPQPQQVMQQPIQQLDPLANETNTPSGQEETNKSDPLECAVCHESFETPGDKGVHVRQTGHKAK